MANYMFTYNQEVGHQGQSLVPHFPGGKSGVTIGPGYDLGHRNIQEIYTDLTNAGIDSETAYALLDAANKTGREANEWISGRGGIIITEEQQRSLFENVLVPEYESRVQEQVSAFVRHNSEFLSEKTEWADLSTKQKEILFDYVYNTGSLSKSPEMTIAVLNEDWDTAALHYERYSGEQPLAYRNEMFFRAFLDPDTFGLEDFPEYERFDELSVQDNLSDEIDHLYFNEADDSSGSNSDEWYEQG